jgi:hypothetical protein
MPVLEIVDAAYSELSVLARKGASGRGESCYARTPVVGMTDISSICESAVFGALARLVLGNPLITTNLNLR